MNYMFSKYLFLLITGIFLTACGETETETVKVNEDLPLSGQIDSLIEQDEYEEALNILQSEDSSDTEIRQLLEKTHLNYGYYNMNTFDEQEMRTRMNNALVQFTEVLRINPDNNAAREQIDQIMSVYATMPDRGPREEVLEGLREVGLNY